MAKGEGGGRPEEDDPDRSAVEDPLGEQTQPIVRPRPPASDPDPSPDHDTTTWSGRQAPPVLVDETEGGTTPSLADDMDAAEDATVVAPLAFEAPDDATAVITAETPDASALDPPEVATTGVAEEATEVATVDLPEEAPRVASTTGDSTARALAPSSSLHPLLLERIEPSLGRGERLRLDAAHWHVRLGRAEHNDLRLYTASASREHAVIAGNEEGEWVLTPCEGKAVAIDGDETVEPVVLEVGMNIVMGGDHLRCVTEGLERDPMAAQTSAEGLGESAAPTLVGRLAGLGPAWWGIFAVAALGLGLILFAWFTG